MATYNGEKYIDEQLQSIIKQVFTDWRLIILDDCSIDGTMGILKRYQHQYADKIIIYENNAHNGSAKNSFFQLLDYAESEYVMFSDQDDVWKDDKIIVTYKKILGMEKIYGIDMPLLVHTDLCVVDYKLNVINESLFSMQQMDYTRDKINNLLIENIVTGCTVMINRALLNFVYKKPRNFVMHDMWLALIAATFGKIGFVNESTILYRQHANNLIGAKDSHGIKYVFRKISSHKKIHSSLIAQYQQAFEFLQIYFDYLDKKDLCMLCEYTAIPDNNIFYRWVSLIKYGLLKNKLIKIIGQLIF